MHPPTSPPRSAANTVSLLQQSALFRIALAVLALGGLWLAIAWAIALP